MHLRPGAMLRLAEPFTPGAGKNALPWLGVSVVAMKVIRVLGDVVHLSCLGVRVLSREQIAEGVRAGKWQVRRPAK